MRKWIPSLALALLVVGCGGGGSTTVVTGTLRGQVVATGLSEPTLFAQNPSLATIGYVLEKAGKVRVIQSDSLQTASAIDLTGTVATAGECGLLGMAFDPSFSTNRYVYLHYNAGSPIETRIVRYTVSTDGLTFSSPYQIFSLVQPSTTNHKGGSINFGGDGFLYIATGDGGGANDPNGYAQSPTSLLGKMLRIDVQTDGFPSDANQNYSIPSTNPYFGSSTVKPEIFAFGLRNPFRWSYDSVLSGFFIADVGQDAYEEIDFLGQTETSANFGWNLREAAHNTSNSGTPFNTPLKDPIHEYNHSVGESVIGGFIYRGSGLPGFNGKYFFADFVSGRIFSAAAPSFTGLGTVTDETSSINVSLGSAALSGPASVSPDANGNVMVVDYSNGNLVRLTN